jgi:hypothetical protein
MADADAPDEDGTSFIEFEGMPVLSRSAFQLHSFGIINSIKDGHPGFVSDAYLNAIAAEATTTALELEAAGMWERRDGGYFIVADEMVTMAIDFNEQSDRQQGECAQRGEPLPSEEGRKTGRVSASTAPFRSNGLTAAQSRCPTAVHSARTLAKRESVAFGG